MRRAAVRRQELWLTPLCEGGLILVAGLAAWLSHRPLLFASLGPTAFEMVEMPERASGRPYNVIVGHLIGVLAGFAALALTHGWAQPSALSATIALHRVWAAVTAAALTAFATLIVRAGQPAALSTTLLISLGSMQTWQDGVWIMAGVLLMTAVGEPVRRRRERSARTRN